MPAELLFATGIRVAELAGPRDDDIDLTAGVIKGSPQRGDRHHRKISTHIADAGLKSRVIERHLQMTGEPVTSNITSSVREVFAGRPKAILRHPGMRGDACKLLKPRTF